ncbi:hypothetical protein IAT38_004711 [Cryptococcus sp. DSM 104549]
MQAPPPLPVPPPPQPAPFVPPPSVLPGPFILLILLPAIPLLLFSLGARPPGTSALPFSTNDLFATTALVTMAGGAVLLLGVWPDAGGQIWGWIRDGDGWDWGARWGEGEGEGEGVLAAWGLGWGGKGVATAAGQRGPGASPVGHAAKQVKAVPEWVWNARIGRWVRAPPLPVVPPLRTVVMPNTRGIHSLAHRHLAALREAYPKYYTPRKPRLIPALLLLALGLFVLVILVGNFLKAAYASEEGGSSSGSSKSSGGSGGSGSGSSSKLPTWVDRELRKRKDEKPDATLKRIKSEEKGERDKAKKKGKDELAKWEKKRDKEKEVLKKELEKRKMALTGLEDDKKAKKKSKDKDKKDDGEGEGEKKGAGSKIKKLLLGDKAEKGESGKGGKEEEGKGSTWKPADEGLAAVTLANSGANAQKMADKLKAGG